MLAESLLTLAGQAGWTVVAAASTDAWDTARHGFAHLLGRDDTVQIALAEQRLDDTRNQLLEKAGTNVEQTRVAQADWWARRLSDLLEEWPAAEAQLRALVQEIQTALPTRSAYALGTVAVDDDLTIAAPRQRITYAPVLQGRDVVGDQTIIFPAARQQLVRPKQADPLPAQISLASWIGEAGNVVAARDQFEGLLTVCERVLGAEHPDTLAVRSEFAYWTGQAGNVVAARDQFEGLLTVCERVLGAEHPDTLTGHHNLANFTGYAGDAAGARDQFAALLPVRERVSGPDHPDTLIAWLSFAYWTGNAGDADRARDHFDALLSVRERVSGQHHPATLAVWRELAYWTGQAGDPVAAHDQFASLVTVCEQVLGAEHSDTLTSRRYLADFTGYVGDAAGARDQFAALVPIFERVLGPSHPRTLSVQMELAYWTGNAGDAVRARSQLVALLADQERSLGPDHPDTLATKPAWRIGLLRLAMRRVPAISTPHCCRLGSRFWVGIVRIRCPRGIDSLTGPRGLATRSPLAINSSRC